MGKLKPDDTGGTYTVTNVGTFGSVLEHHYQSAASRGLALGAIRKVPAVIETQKEILSVFVKECSCHSYDHRVVDGALGGFVK
jgi:2-oxoglutarate dehydrogenase E2 component (dihydrolipoamide succinyltransferase)